MPLLEKTYTAPASNTSLFVGSPFTPVAALARTRAHGQRVPVSAHGHRDAEAVVGVGVRLFQVRLLRPAVRAAASYTYTAPLPGASSLF